MELAKIYNPYSFAPQDSSLSQEYAVSDLNTPSFNIDKVKGHYAFWSNNNGINNIMIMGRIRTTADSNENKPYDAALSGLSTLKIDRGSVES